MNADRETQKTPRIKRFNVGKMGMRPDDCRIRERNMTDNVAWLKRFAISLLKQVKDKASIAGRRRKCGWSEQYLAQVVFGIEG